MDSESFWVETKEDVNTDECKAYFVTGEEKSKYVCKMTKISEPASEAQIESQFWLKSPHLMQKN